MVESNLVEQAQPVEAEKTKTGAEQNESEEKVIKKWEQPLPTLHYAIINRKLMNCMGNKWMPQADNVKLDNGTIITVKGEVATKHWGKITKMKEGECVDLQGNITDHKKAHAATEIGRAHV